MRYSRRQFLAAGGPVAGASLLGGIHWARRLWGQRLNLPGRFVSQDGLLEAMIESGSGRGTIAGRPAVFLGFNGQVPGPLLEVRAGDTVQMRYTNRLAEVSNVHYHGLHVDPNGRGDNIFLEVEPGESWQYDFTLPAKHLGGTFWYHPHVHGSTARQLGGGLAGLLVVRGELDQIPEIASATEYLFVLQDFGVRPDGTVGPGPLLTVNGAINPRLALPQDGMLRLRLLNAAIDRYFRLRLEDHPLYLIATEGGGIPEPVEVSELLIAPGQRFEVLVRGERPPGTYRLLNLFYESQISGMAAMATMEGHEQVEEAQVIATVGYEGRAERRLELPRRLLRVDPLPPSNLPLRSFEFRTQALPGGFVFQINGRDFDHRRVDTQVNLATVEDWEIINADPMDHPIHLHTNSFQIIGPNGEPERAWSDIINVKPGERRRFRVRFEDYPGRTVYHCHRVAHGDLGMMGVIEMTSLLPPRARVSG